MAHDKVYGICKNKCMVDITSSLEGSAIKSISGKNIEFSGLSSNIPVSVTGESKQISTTGVQKLNTESICHVSGVNCEIDKNVMKFTVNSAGKLRQMEFNLGAADDFDGKTITISASEWERNHTYLSKIFLRWRTSTDTYISDVEVMNYGILNATLMINKPENATSLLLLFQINSNSTSVGDYTEITDLSVNEGSSVLPWEPYTGGKSSPNMDYPQDIINIGDNGNLVVRCTSEDNYKDLNIPLSKPLREINGIADKIIKNADGKWGIMRYFDKIIFDGSKDEGWSTAVTPDGKDFRYISSDIQNKAKAPTNDYEKSNNICTSYIVITADSVRKKNTGFSYNSDGIICIYDENYNTDDISLWKSALAGNPMTVVYELVKPVWEEFPMTVQDAFNTFMSFDGENILETTKESTAICKPLNTLGNVKDEFIMQDGVYGIMRRVGKVIFDGSLDEAWYKIGSNTLNLYLNISGFLIGKSRVGTTGDVVPNIFCDKLPTISPDKLYLCNEGVTLNYESNFYIYLHDYASNDIAALNAYLAENPFTVYYELLNPYFEPVNEFLHPVLDVDYATTPYGANLLDFSANIKRLGKLLYGSKIISNTDIVAKLEPGIYKIFGSIPADFPADIMAYKYGILTISDDVDAYRYVQLCVTDAMNSESRFKCGFVYRNCVRWSDNEKIIPVTPLLNRPINVVGGYIKRGNVVFVDISFTAAASSNNTPSIFNGLPATKVFSALSCVCFDMSGNIYSTNDAIVSHTGVILCHTIEKDKQYTISGSYLINAT